MRDLLDATDDIELSQGLDDEFDQNADQFDWALLQVVLLVLYDLVPELQLRLRVFDGLGLEVHGQIDLLLKGIEHSLGLINCVSVASWCSSSVWLLRLEDTLSLLDSECTTIPVGLVGTTVFDDRPSLSL